MNTAKLMLQVDFRHRSAQDTSGMGNHGILVAPEFGKSFDGGTALFLNNPFGKASHYLLFEQLKGIDLTRDSFSVVFWMKTLYGGCSEWTDKDHRSKPGTLIDMTKAQRGGVLVANMTCQAQQDGVAAVLLPHHAYMSAGIRRRGALFAVDGIRPPQDGRWHQIALLLDRGGSLNWYVDDLRVASIDVAHAAGAALGVNALAFGADVSGDYGIGAAYFDRIRLYQNLIGEESVMDSFYEGRFERLRHEARRRLAAAGPQYSDQARARMGEALGAAKACTDSVAGYNALRVQYEAFLESPQADAQFTALLLGDPHIQEVRDRCANNMDTMLADLAACHVRADVMFSVGDNANRSDYACGKNAFTVFDELMTRYQVPWQLVACHGNHETMYESETENYWEGARAYLEGISQHLLENGKHRRAGTVLDELYRDVSARYLGKDSRHAGCSFGVTVHGYHVLVINTDHVPQTSSSRQCVDEDGNYTIQGNRLDPIRHGMMLYEGTFAWLRSMLDRYSKGKKPVFVLCHYPFADTVPLSYYREIVIDDNSIGKQDAQIRALLSEYDTVFYICGHLHSGFGLAKPATVTSGITGRSFWEISISSLHTIVRGHCSIPSGWILFLYETEIVLRARDHRTGQWLCEYDEVIPLGD